MMGCAHLSGWRTAQTKGSTSMTPDNNIFGKEALQWSRRPPGDPMCPWGYSVFLKFIKALVQPHKPQGVPRGPLGRPT